MAILNSIRKRGIFLIIIIAMALFAFVLSGVIGNGSNSPKGESNIATINDVDISREDFMKKVENVQRNLGPNNGSNQAMNIVWEQELRRVLLEEQYVALGLTAEKSQISEALKTNLANNPTFQDELGMFSEAVMQDYIANAKFAADAGDRQAYQAWLDFEKSTATTVLENNFYNLIKGGLITTRVEGEQEYHFQNDQINLSFVQIPYTKISDEEVTVTDKEIETYIRAHSSEFEVAPQVDIQYVTFNEDPSAEDINAAEVAISSLVDELTATSENAEFVNANSEVGYTDRWFLKADVPEIVADQVMNLELNTVHGPYKDGDTYNLVKVFEKRQMADSAKAKHILIRYQGLRTAPASVVRTKEDARTLADSINTVVNSNKSKFDSLALAFSEDDSNKAKGGDLGYFGPGRMVPEFNNFVFDNKAGDIGVVETDFGFHIIHIEELKNLQDAVKIANVVKKIEPSEKTINDVFSTATKFEIAAEDKDFTELANEAGETVKPVNKINELDSNIPGVGNNRSIVNWAFNEETNIGDVKRFNVANGYVIVQLTRRNPKGLMSIAEASSTVSPILRNEKKAKLIRESITATNIDELAKNQTVAIKTANAVSMGAPTLAGGGTEPKVVGVAFGTTVGETSGLIDGDNGVYMVKVLSFNKAPELENYTPFANQLNAQTAPSIRTNLFNALKDAAVIEDHRADFY
jgi:peptidylprolyl isomerase/peptidyl-prolyl cis-trans isomerase D